LLPEDLLEGIAEVAANLLLSTGVVERGDFSIWQQLTAGQPTRLADD
jgi:hypothetical protein